MKWQDILARRPFLTAKLSQKYVRTCMCLLCSCFIAVNVAMPVRHVGHHWILGPLLKKYVHTVGAKNMFPLRSELRYKTSGQLRTNFGPTSHELRANFGPTSHELWANFGPTSHELRANFGSTSHELRASFARTSGKLRTNFGRKLGQSSYEVCSNFV